MFGFIVFDPSSLGVGVTEVLQLSGQLAAIVWLLNGGLIFLIRTVSWYIDKYILSFIARLYFYFDILIRNDMFNEKVVSNAMKNIYIFIGVIIFFRLMMVILKYIVNPELVSDGKVGANQLIKRVIIGLAGIIMIPTIFSSANKFEAAILEDQVIQGILVPEGMRAATQKKIQNAGSYIGTYVLSGFINPSASASQKAIADYKVAVRKGDITSIDINKGVGFLAMGSNYEYGYFFFLSTFVLGYVLFLMAKYCLDLAIRFFKLFIYQLIAPIAMIEYMLNGSQDGVFKNWKNAVLSSYCMIFIRVFSIWFVIFVMTLMSGDLNSNIYTNGSLLSTSDNLLRAIIMVALLAFLMDLPKIVGQVFGLDLEQESSATGLLNSIKGGIGKIAGAGLAMGGAFAGGVIGSAKGLAKGDMKTAANSLKEARKGMIKSAMGANQFTSAAYSGYTGVRSAIKEGKNKDKAEAAQKEQEERENRREQREINRDRQNTQYQNDVRRGFSNLSTDNLALQVQNSLPKNASYEAVLDATANANLMATAQASGWISTTGDVRFEVAASKDIMKNLVERDFSTGSMSDDDVTRDVYTKMGSKLGVSEQTVREIVQTASGADNATKAQNIVDRVYNAAIDVSKEEVAPSVRKVYGNRTMTNVEATGDRIVDSVNNASTNVSERVDEMGENVTTTVDKVNDSIKRNTVITRNAATTINDTLRREGERTRRTIDRK